MAGHSKWANIRFRKGAQDAKRGKIFTKIAREITIAAKMGGGDPASNPRLRAAIDKGLSNNMTRDKIERATKKGTGELEGGAIEEVTYEGYGPNGIAVMVECATDNRNRTVSEVRHAFTKHGGNLGTDGSVAYLFSRQGMINFAPGADEEQIMELALEAGAEDIDSEEDGSVSVVTPWEKLSDVVEALKSGNLEPEIAEVAMVASNVSECDADSAEKVLRLVDALEELDDVQNVYSNAGFPEELLQS